MHYFIIMLVCLTLLKDLLSSGISILKVSLSPILTVSTSLSLASKMRILGGGASGAEVMLIASGSLLIQNILDS